jgi:coproporphyrinogen III oxidase-like Fe-S oxidoreductase
MKEREGRIKRYNEQKMDGMRNEGMRRVNAGIQFTNEWI